MNYQNSTTVILNTPKIFEATGERADANWNWLMIHASEHHASPS